MKKRRKHGQPEERVSFDVSTSWDDSNANDPFSNESVLLKSHRMKRTLSQPFVEDSDHSLKECFATDFSDIFCGNSSASTVEIDTCCSETIPSDLRLGTKLRVITRKPYMWMRDTSNSGVVPVRVTGQQRHEGLQLFLKLVGTDDGMLRSTFFVLEERRSQKFLHVMFIIYRPIYESVEFEVLRRKTRSRARTSASFKFSTDGDSRLDFDWQGVTQSQPPPFSNERKSPDNSEDKENTTNGSDSDRSPEKADSSGDHEWLETIGMSPRKSAKLKRYKSLGSSSNLADVGQSKLDFEEVAAVLVKKSSQVIRRKEVEYVLELDGGPAMPHCIPLIVELLRRTGLCKDDAAIIRISDRAHCNGINEADLGLCDWNEIRVSDEKIEWDKL
ncbi:unnamed protein product [Haemonchus placei]|uniref:SH2 domain-containing protein n=1 Tax=Haemonchus placei TaxID=6290 RepID=A0A0N4WKV7_HAEPC|nr:unnamed protein product [Haemonchus placei]